VSNCSIAGCDEESRNGFGLCADHCAVAGSPTPTAKAQRWLTASKQHPTRCDHCALELHVLLVGECGHLVCPECVTEESTCCPVDGCAFEFNVEWFSFMQPSFEIEYTPNETCPECNVDFQDFPKVKTKGRTKEVLHYDACSPQQKGEMDRHKQCQFWRHTGPNTFSKAKQVIQLIETLERNPQTAASYKIVIFSQFRDALNYFGDKLIRYRPDQSARGDYHFLAEYSADRQRALRRFKEDSDCKVLLLEKGQIKGLDLSFVTHMFALEEVLDLALWEQLVGRS
jgi:hypothetical protein